MVLALIAAVAFAIGCDIYDVVLTEKGIKAEVAVEGNTFLVGSKPSALALYLRDSLAIGAATVPAVLALVGHNDPLFWGFIVGPIVVGIRHIGGGRQWRFLLNGGKLDTTRSTTAWQKFIEW